MRCSSPVCPSLIHVNKNLSLTLCSHNMTKTNDVQTEDGLEGLVILENIVVPCVY